MRRYLLVVFLSLFVVSSLSVDLVHAQERGRLEDGRAYRVGSDGFRLVDEIAELQVSNDDLRKQVATLGAELDRHEDGPTKCPVPPLPSAKGPTPSCDELVSSLYLRISRLENQLEPENGSALPAATLCNFDSQKNPYKTEVRGLESQLSKSRQEIERLSEELLTRNEEISDKERQIAALDARVLNTASKPQVAPSCDYAAVKNPYIAKIKTLEAELAALEDRGDSRLASANTRARLAPKGKPVALGVKVVDRSGDSADSIDGIQSQLRVRLSQIDKLIGKRKSLYDKIKSKQRMMSLQLQRLETKRGMSLDSIRRQVNRVKHQSQVAGINSGINQIERLLEEDIAVLNRFLK